MVSDERKGAPIEGRGDGEDDASALYPTAFVNDGLDEYGLSRTGARRRTGSSGGGGFGGWRGDGVAADGGRLRSGRALRRATDRQVENDGGLRCNDEEEKREGSGAAGHERVMR